MTGIRPECRDAAHLRVTYKYPVTFLGTIALIAAILVVWFLGALVVGLAVGRMLKAMGYRAPFRRDFDRAA